MAQCELCEKGTTFGSHVSHPHSTYIGGRGKRTFKPNLKHRTVTVDGRNVRMTLCTRCSRTLLKTNRPRQ